MAENKMPEPSAKVAEKLWQKVHEGLGIFKLLKELKEEEEKEEETPSSFMDMIFSSERENRSEEEKSKISFLDLI